MSNADLIAAYEKFNEKHQFSVGQLVEWKPNLKNKKSPGPFVVVEVLVETSCDMDTKAGSPYYREPYDVILGYVDGDGDFLCGYFDSRRFQPAE